MKVKRFLFFLLAYYQLQRLSNTFYTNGLKWLLHEILCPHSHRPGDRKELALPKHVEFHDTSGNFLDLPFGLYTTKKPTCKRPYKLVLEN